MTDDEGRRKALIVSAHSYDRPKLRQLRSPAGDAEALRRVLAGPEIGGFHDVALSPNEANQVVRRKIEDFFKEGGLEDLLVLHFGCHGIKDDDGNLYFASADTEFTRLESTAIAADFVVRQMDRSRARRIVLLLDCCYSGAFSAGAGHARRRRCATSRSASSASSRATAAVVLTASTRRGTPGGDDLKDQDTGASSFTAALVHGLETGEASRNQHDRISLTRAVRLHAQVRPGAEPQADAAHVVVRHRGRPLHRPALCSWRRWTRASSGLLHALAAARAAGGSEVFSVADQPRQPYDRGGSVGVILVWRARRRDPYLDLWRRNPARLEDVHERFVYSVAFSPDGRRLATGGEDGVVHVRDLEQGRLLARPAASREAVYSVAFSADGTLLATGGYDRKVLIRDDATSGRVRRELKRPHRVSSRRLLAEQPREAPRHRRPRQYGHVLGSRQRRQRALPDTHHSSVERVVFSPDGARLASCGLDKAVRVWDAGGARRPALDERGRA